MSVNAAVEEKGYDCTFCLDTLLEVNPVIAKVNCGANKTFQHGYHLTCLQQEINFKKWRINCILCRAEITEYQVGNEPPIRIEFNPNDTLIEAVKSGEVNIIRELLDSEAKNNISNISYNRAISLAVNDAQVQIVRLLAEKHNYSDDCLSLNLARAASRPEEEYTGVINVLVEKIGEAHIDENLRGLILRNAGFSGRLDLVQSMCGKGVPRDKLVNAFFAAASDGKIEVFRYLLENIPLLSVQERSEAYLRAIDAGHNHLAEEIRQNGPIHQCPRAIRSVAWVRQLAQGVIEHIIEDRAALAAGIGSIAIVYAAGLFRAASIS